jgi:UDP-N-acetylglucosamine--N-acetylmuramyl-(pentapeptide) pyrophosphoryl-undecaprenol N-acetylglucosamine transferase
MSVQPLLLSREAVQPTIRLGATRNDPALKDTRLKLCLAASGGGHVRQLLDLEPVWRDADYVFVTEDTVLGRSLADKHPVRFVDHYALGQARLGRGAAMLGAAVRNFLKSAYLVATEKPDVVITTGAGAVYWTALIGKARGAKIVLIDSFARVDAPSKFARGLKPFADEVVVQAPAVAKRWPDAHLFDPLRLIDGTPPDKEPLLFATVGATLDFPRMVEAVLALKASGRLPERVVLQVGDAPVPDALPDGVEVHSALDYDTVQALLRRAAFVVCHGGTGSLITALRQGCRTVAMPRRFSLGEHYDDHQEQITAAFKSRAQPMMATTDHSALIAFLRTRLSGWAPAR